MFAARRCLLVASLVITAGAIVGCTQADQWTISKMLSNPGYDDGDERKTADWVENAGSEARQGRMVEKQLDPLGLREIFMSDKARSIEKNLGIE